MHPYASKVITHLVRIGTQYGWHFEEETLVYYKVFLQLSDVLLSALESENPTFEQVIELVQREDLSTLCVSRRATRCAETARRLFLQAITEVQSNNQDLWLLSSEKLPQRYCDLIPFFHKPHDELTDVEEALMILYEMKGILPQGDEELIRQLLLLLDEDPQPILKDVVTHALSRLYRQVHTKSLPQEMVEKLAWPLKRLGRTLKHQAKKELR